MLCYHDMTFCESDCTNSACKRHFGAEDRKKAVAWWGNENAPVAFSDFSYDCPLYKPEPPK